MADPGSGTDRLAVVLIPSRLGGHRARARFWQTTALCWRGKRPGSTLTRVVFVPEALIFYPNDAESMDPIQARGFVWFELLVSASYLGAATHLAERVAARGRGLSDEDRARLAIELETTAAALENGWLPLPRRRATTMRCWRGRSTRDSQPSGPSSAWSFLLRRNPRRHVVHRVARDRLLR